ncbi:hypothetical protein [Methanolobus chelungpuianus]|uniref:Uncharacterized protein n=1 Tax=Methanolobus chelungpuianus TaxID=502115 RepID=A0AAE3HAN8_9EURY|nr:hypothetical protein [Methanolobus chelungpuianus]MCQ6962800.1 hypothetical protein [Methanolobus chelungpuianus]
MRPCIFLLALCLLIVPASAEISVDGVYGDTIVYLHNDITSFTETADSGNVYNFISVTSGLDANHSYSINSNTYEIDVVVGRLNWYSSTLSVDYYSLVTGNSTSYTNTIYHMGLISCEVSAGVIDNSVEGSLKVKTGMSAKKISDETVYAPSSVSLSSTTPIDLRISQLDGDIIGIGLTDTILNIIDAIPFVGPYIGEALRLSAWVLGAFFSGAWFFVNNIMLFFFLFETGVFLHGIVIIRGKGPKHRRITKSIGAIVNDNRIALEVCFTIIMRGLELVYRVIQAIGNWIPFT